MPRVLIDLFGTRTPFTAGAARTWLRNGGVAVTPLLDASIPAFVASGARAYGFLRHDRFMRDLKRWYDIQQFANAFGANPLATLQQHAFLVEPRMVADTAPIATYLTFASNLIVIGSRAFCLQYDDADDPLDKAEPALLGGIVNFTGMRSNTDVNRFAAPVITAGGSWWFTPIQTGCTVIICDWGNGGYSMTHLQPYDDADYGWMLQYVLEKYEWFKAQFKKLALQTNVSAVVAASGQVPERYILVQSNHTAETENVIVIGYRPGGGAWQFFYQRYPRFTQGPVTAAEAIEWQLWNDRWNVTNAYRGAI